MLMVYQFIEWVASSTRNEEYREEVSKKANE